MIWLLLLVAQLASAQDISSGTPGVPISDELEAQKVGVQLRELQSGHPLITGIPQFKNGICFSSRSDCMTNAASGGGAGLSSTQTFTGGNTFTQPIIVSTSEPKGNTPAQNGLYSENVPKAWVIFPGTGTVTIQDAFNVASITDNGVGDWTVNFARSFFNAFYACTIACESSAGVSVDLCEPKAAAQTASAIRILDYNSTDGASLRDANRVHVVCFGRQ